MNDFTEQLFKHEGYCVWSNDEDAYDTMEEWMENWPTQCNQLNNPDSYGELGLFYSLLLFLLFANKRKNWFSYSHIFCNSLKITILSHRIGNTLYMDVQPLPEGNMTLGMCRYSVQNNLLCIIKS